MAWAVAMLRGQRVLARCDECGEWISEKGRVEVRYSRGASKAYLAAERNLRPIAGEPLLPDGACAPAQFQHPKKARGASKSKGSAKAPTVAPTPPNKTDPSGPILAYTDGACSGNPGPAGLGVVVLDGATRRELSEYLGQATNNVAELTAIVRAAEALRGAERPVELYTDSRYAIGVLTKGWKAKANTQLVAEAKVALSGLQRVHLLYVPGHVGVELNERADALARQAIRDADTSGWITSPE